MKRNLLDYFTPKASGERSNAAPSITPPAAMAVTPSPAQKRSKSSPHAWGSLVQPSSHAQMEGRKPPYSLNFIWPFSDYARYPGSGDFAFDSIRNPNQRFWTTEEADYVQCLTTVLQLNLIIEPAAYAQVCRKIQALDADSIALLATLFYRRNVRWTRLDKQVVSVGKSSNVQQLVDDDMALCETSNSSLASCMELFTVEELLQHNTGILARKKPKNKTLLVQALLQKGSEYPVPCIRLREEVFAILTRIHQYVFCSCLLEPEDAVCIISCSKLLPSASTTTSNPIHSHCWERLKLALDWVEEMSKEIARGNAERVYYLLHLACTDYGKRSCCGEECNLNRKRLDLLQRVLLAGIHLLEREKKHSEAVHYLQIIFQGWEELKRAGQPQQGSSSTRRLFFMAKIIHRLSLDLASHLNRPLEALELLERVLSEDNLFLQNGRTTNRLGGVGMGLIQYCAYLSKPPRRWNARIRYPVTQMPEHHIKVNKQPGRRVEHLALEAYLARGEFTHGMHCENGIVHTLFGILFLDAPAAFNDFMLEPDWREKLDAIKREDVSLSALLCECWNRKRAWNLRGVNWTRNTLQELDLFSRAMGRNCLSAICESFIDAYEAWCGGVGDLLLWSWNKIKFVEVKGPGDSLSDRQIAWGEMLLKAGADVEVCYVTWSNSTPREAAGAALRAAVPREVIEISDDDE